MTTAVVAAFMTVAAITLLGGSARDRLASLGRTDRRWSVSSRVAVIARGPRRRHDHRNDVVALADGWAGELAAGRPTLEALRRACGAGPPAFVEAARRLDHGADPADVLARIAGLHGGAGARALIGCWRISATGGALAATVGRTADALRVDVALRDEIAAQVAAPRATARLVASLPLVGPVLGALVGADTVAVLFDTTVGRGLLIGGIALDALGWWWVQRLVRSAEEQA